MTDSAKTLQVTLPSDTEIKLVRTFDAPRKLVFEAITDPDLIPQWWGPRNSTTKVLEMDVRPGGAWRYVNTGSDGTDHPFKGTYREIAGPERLVYTFIYDVAPFDQYESVENVVFEEHDGKTTMTNVTVHPSKEARDGHLNAGMESGATETMDRFAELLARLA